MILNTLLPAFQAPVPERSQAAATASWAFIGSFGNIWGVAIPAAILNSRVEQLAATIRDDAVRDMLSSGHAYEIGTAAFVGALDEKSGLRVQVSIGFSAMAFLLAFLEREIPLRTELETDFGLMDEAKEREQSVALLPVDREQQRRADPEMDAAGLA